MRFLQTERSTAWLRCRIVLGSTSNVADPQAAHELEAWKSAKIVGVPFPQGGVLRCLADDRVLHDRVAEVVNHCCDGECATEPLVQTRFSHCYLLDGLMEASHRLQRWLTPSVGGHHALAATTPNRPARIPLTLGSTPIANADPGTLGEGWRAAQARVLTR